MTNKLGCMVASVVCGGFMLVALILGVWLMGQYNTAASLKNTYESKVKANEVDFDNMWKKIQQVAQVTSAQKDALKEIFTSYAQARTTESKNLLSSWIKESVPNVDTSTFNNLQNIIVGSRDGWTMRQKELVDISRQYNEMLVRFPGNMILGMFGFQKIDPKIITSSRTEEAFSTGKDDNVDLGLNNKNNSTNTEK
jgi:hypothetical protein